MTAFSDEEYENDYHQKWQGLENTLGKSHDIVGHAIIPFSVGGAVDMYYFPNHINGTGFATMELLEPDGSGPLPNNSGTYELVAFTKHAISDDPLHPFNLIERRVCGIFTSTGFYSRKAILEPGDTCEIPNDEGEDSTCLIFDNYQSGEREFIIGNRKHYLLLCIEVFRSEMEFARTKGSGELFKKLKERGYFPYSDLDRPPVI